MMNIISKIALSILLIASVASCSFNKEIPSDTLEKIFTEVALTSAVATYSTSVRASADSTDLYCPILDKYGYTISDLRFTLEKHISRKTSVLESMLINAKASIEHRRDYQQFIYDLVEKSKDNIDKLLADTLVNIDTTILYKNHKNIDSVRFEIPLNGQGKYNLKLDYIASTKSPAEIVYATLTIADTLFGEARNLDKQTKIYRLPVRKVLDSTLYDLSFKFEIATPQQGNIAYLNLATFNHPSGRSSYNANSKRKLSKVFHLEITNLLLTRTLPYGQGCVAMLSQFCGVELFERLSPQQQELSTHAPYAPLKVESWGERLPRYAPQSSRDDAPILLFMQRAIPKTISKEELEMMETSEPSEEINI